MSVKDLFPEFHSSDKAALAEMWQTGIVVLDTNALMSIIRFSTKAREDYIGVLEKIRDRLWIPYQVAWELYALLQSEDRHEPTRAYEAIVKAFETAQSGIEKALRDNQKHIEMDVNKLQDQLKRYFAKRVAQVRFSQDEYKRSVESQRLHETIWRLLDGKIGTRFSLAELEALYDEFDRRYARQIPPGYADAQKSDASKYGDALIWYQMVREASTERRPILFVTNDVKPDWWHIAKSRRSPRRELVWEMREKAGVAFHMYTVPDFMIAATEQLKAHIEDTTITEAEQVAQEEQKEQLEREAAATPRRGITVAQLQHALTPKYLTAAESLSHQDALAAYLANSALVDVMQGYNRSAFKSVIDSMEDMIQGIGPQATLAGLVSGIISPHDKFSLAGQDADLAASASDRDKITVDAARGSDDGESSKDDD